METIETIQPQQDLSQVNQTAYSPIAETPKRTRGKLLIFIFVGLGILLLIGGVLYYFLSDLSNEKIDMREEAIVPTSTPEVTPSVTPTPVEENELDSDSLIMEIEGSTESLGGSTDSMNESLDKLDFDSADSELQNTVF
ncbi:MAG: hypothetical protein QG570_46 [Patescibacteria group bacterium]|nr:hypothetical protein [Patescibacteria group bacterium]